MEDLVARHKGWDYYESLPEDQQKLITKVFLSTIDICSELITEIEGKPMPIFFYEDVAYKVLRAEMLGHMLNDEMYNANTGTWQKGDEFNPKYD